MQDNKTDSILAEGEQPRVVSSPVVFPGLRLSQRWASIASWRSALLAIFAFSGVAAFGFAPGTQPDPHPTTTLERALTLPSALPTLDALDDVPYWREERVQRGDTIGNVLARAGMRDAQAMNFIVTDASARALYKLRPGRPLRVALNSEGQLQSLRLLVSETEMFTINRNSETLTAATVVPERDVRREHRAGEIVSSLFGAADTAGIPDPITIAMVDVLGGDIDFYHDLRKGDQFAVLYERVYVDGELIGNGRILAVEFTNQGHEYSAYWWQNPEGGTSSYYSAKGESSRKAFLRAPLEFSRVSSNFTTSRLHPLFKNIRAHTGTDFAAPTGTPVRAAGDGTVDFIGVKGGYGNIVILRHGGKVTTYYGHLSRFGSYKKGERVAQGEVIGYVGQTGYATGPHLHYEFRVADVPYDPLKAVLPPAAPIAAQYKGAFEAHVATAKTLLQMARETPSQKYVMAE